MEMRLLQILLKGLLIWNARQLSEQSKIWISSNALFSDLFIYKRFGHIIPSDVVFTTSLNFASKLQIFEDRYQFIYASSHNLV